MPSPVLFCSAAIWSEYAEQIKAAAPGIDVVQFSAGDRIGLEDVNRITIAFSSDDLYPEGLPAFFRVVLESTSLEWIQLVNAGIDHPVFGLMLDKGLRMTTGSGVTSVPIAHHVIMCLLALARDLPGSLARQHQHQWTPRSIEDLEGRTVGVLGMGPIGTETARLAEHFGMNAIGMRRTVTGYEQCETWTFDRLDELLASVDDLVLALPLTDDTRQLISAREFALMRPGARLVNVGRGELIDESAMVAALQSGHLGGAGLDVFAEEPLPSNSLLWDMPNVIITPHTSGQSPMSVRRGAELFISNLGRWHRDEPLQNEVLPDVAPRPTAR